MEWIDVGDNLPEDGELCIICTDTYDGYEVADCYACYNYESDKWYWWVDGPADDVDGNVSYWMPLPQPPKE